MAADDKDDDQTRSFTVLIAGVFRFKEELIWHLLFDIMRESAPSP